MMYYTYRQNGSGKDGNVIGAEAKGRHAVVPSIEPSFIYYSGAKDKEVSREMHRCIIVHHPHNHNPKTRATDAGVLTTRSTDFIWLDAA